MKRHRIYRVQPLGLLLLAQGFKTNTIRFEHSAQVFFRIRVLVVNVAIDM